MSTRKKPSTPKSIEALTYPDAKRVLLPTAELQPVMAKSELELRTVTYERGVKGLEDEKETRDPDLDPQLIWRGKDQQDWSDLVVNAPPLYIQEKVHPKVLIDDLRRMSDAGAPDDGQIDLFADFNGVPEGADKTDFYQHEGHWSNRMILGDSLQVMASLAEREGLRGKVQCIYLDPPYGIKFNSNFQWSTTSRGSKDENPNYITREPEQVKAFRDTWRDGVNSYLTYLRDRLTVSRDLLADSGSIFVQIGDENVHRVRALMDEVFGDGNYIAQIDFQTTSSRGADHVDSIVNYLLWYAKRKESLTTNKLFSTKGGETGIGQFDFILNDSGIVETVSEANDYNQLIDKLLAHTDTTSQGETAKGSFILNHNGFQYLPPSNRHWSQTNDGMQRLQYSGRLFPVGKRLRAIRFLRDNNSVQYSNIWTDTVVSGFAQRKEYVVQTTPLVIQRCILMGSNPGDLVLDPTCGSGTTAYVAEQWGRRWITIDTSRVALTLARARIMGARYPYYLLTDSKEGQLKEAEVTRTAPSSRPTFGNIKHGFVYERVPHITLKSIANNTEIDVIWEDYEQRIKLLREQLTAALPPGWLAAFRKKQKYTAEVPSEIQEWEIPREAPEWSVSAQHIVAEFWKQRIARQREIDASIAAKAEYEYLYDKPYEDRKKVRVAGPFTVESLSPHRMLAMDENDNLIDQTNDGGDSFSETRDFASMILENLKTSGVQQVNKDDRIVFTSMNPWPGTYICAEATYESGTDSSGKAKTKRAGIFIGPEFGTVSRPDLVEAAREAADVDFDVLIACAFNYEAHTTEFEKLGRIPVLKARMNADLHMADDLKNTGKGNLFVIFGEPDIEITPVDGDQICVKVNGVDVFDPSSGKVRSDGPDGIACWFIDTDYNEESFFVRHAYFLGASDPYKALKTTLKAEIDADAWDSLNSATSRPFDRPKSGRVAVKVINHLGDEVMKVFRV